MDDALTRGTWTEEDRTELRGSTANLPIQARMEVFRPLIVAVNAGKVHFEGQGPLF